MSLRDDCQRWLTDCGRVIEEETSLDKIPAGAAAAIRKAAPDGKMLLVETVTEAGKIVYEAQISKGGKKSEIQVNASGQRVKQ